MLINELSKRTGITVHTIRFYEKSGLIKGKRDETVTSNNYFHYDEESVERLQLILDAKSVGFTISEIAEMIDAWYTDKIPVEAKLKVLDEKLESIDVRIRQLQEMKARIADFRQDIESGEC
jgi:MerR family Zn(II)-responsive transcriptional regulator of zntA